jgi:hypothetical protein
VKRLPKIIVESFGSARMFRAYHRRAVRAAIKTLDRAMVGSAYAPGYRDLVAAREALDRASEKARVANWERATSHSSGAL